MTSETAATLPSRLVGSVVHLTPTTVDRWLRCPRQYLLRNVVQLPEIDRGPWSNEGLKVHAVLRHLHEHGSCDDRTWVREVVDNHGAGDTERLLGFVERHARMCPRGAEPLGHEVELARLHREPPPVFLGSGAIDAVWVHDGVLDARDYKTGAGVLPDISHDARARVQAWLLAPEARRRRLGLRIRYEFLAPEVEEEPPAWDPDVEEVEAVGAELLAVADAIRAERDFPGVSDPAVCRHCSFRSVCIHAATEGKTSAP